MKTIALQSNYAVSFERLYSMAGEVPVWRECIDLRGSRDGAETAAQRLRTQPRHFRNVQVVKRQVSPWAVCK